MRYFKNSLSDLRNSRVALHPILLAATFCIVKFSWPRLIGNVGESDALGSFIFMDFVQCACFIALGAHLVYVAGRGGKNSQSRSYENSDYEGFIQPRGLRYLAVLRAILCALCIIACVAGYLSADVNHQKLGVMNWFFPTALASAFIYSIAIWFVTTGSEVLIWGVVFVISYVVAYYAVWIGFFTIPGEYGGLAFWKRAGDNISSNLGVLFQAHLQKAPSRGDARGVMAN